MVPVIPVKVGRSASTNGRAGIDADPGFPGLPGFPGTTEIELAEFPALAR